MILSTVPADRYVRPVGLLWQNRMVKRHIAVEALMFNRNAPLLEFGKSLFEILF
ncbi:hypothetical protein [Haloterrigena salinisoli]|uniref:hypothetical protein n=1 Tax=Haloterrigena salinisoli TaxID=3132747 RepID=UPI0030D160D3